MFELSRYEGRTRVKGGVYLSIGLATLAALVIWVYPSFRDSMNMDELLRAYPEPMLQVMGIRTMASLEGFLAVELYMFGWVILLGLYFAYSAASTIADDVERGRMEILLSLPISRARVVGEKFAALAVPIALVNVLTPVVVLVGAELIGESLSTVDLLVVHLLSIPYLFACAGIGLLASVVFDRTSIAQRVALGVTFGLFLLESLLADTDYEVVGAIAPMRYYDPNEILLEGTYDPVSAGVLLAMAAILLVASATWFTQIDVD
ncbi:ABC transporter permease [Natribaculum luteum]|uniref:ABC transporter permease n=1 Tax=Natribaculum luteum TaxID=1586232 RepID=A0ABD5NUJ5_9EURY|nr:ABC transporter permease subunit [Natribaculum luteum]